MDSCITLDLGNTALKMAAWQGDQLLARQRWGWRDNPHATWQQVSAMLKPLNIDRVALCSVVPTQTQALLNLLQPHYRVRLVKPMPLPHFSLGQYLADQLGTDRWVNALAASQLFVGQTVMIISMGTSTTLDCIAPVNGIATFQGGAIVPGLRLFAQSLSTATDRLPMTPFPTEPITVPGTSTLESLKTGLSLGYAALVQGFVSAWPSDTVLLTGGDATHYRAMDPQCAHWQHQPLLTHWGLKAALPYA
jgi:type III pantothenate kinase